MRASNYRCDDSPGHRGQKERILCEDGCAEYIHLHTVDKVYKIQYAGGHDSGFKWPSTWLNGQVPTLSRSSSA